MSVVAIEDGYDFHVLVLVLDGTWVVRTPRRPAVAEALAVEAALLPRLAEALPVQVPRFEHVSSFAVYRLIDGQPLRDEDARPFLDALHAFDVGGLPVPAPDWIETYVEQADEFRRVVLPLLDVDERPAADALLAEAETLSGFTPVLTHSDLGPEHMRCRDGRLVGVIDWGDTRVGDPAIDYAWLLNGPFPDWGGGRRAAPPRALLPPARPVVRGALRRRVRHARAPRPRARGDQDQTLTGR